MAYISDAAYANTAHPLMVPQLACIASALPKRANPATQPRRIIRHRRIKKSIIDNNIIKLSTIEEEEVKSRIHTPDARHPPSRPPGEPKPRMPMACRGLVLFWCPDSKNSLPRQVLTNPEVEKNADNKSARIGFFDALCSGAAAFD